MPTPLAPRLPLRLDEVYGPYGLITDQVELVKQNFKMLLLTLPGERIMNPDYGVGMKRYLFEQNGPPTYTAINDRIVAQVKKYMNYIQINKIDFSYPEDSPDLFPHTLSVSILFTIVPLQAVTELQIDFDN